VLRIAAARLLVSVAAAASFAAFLGPWWWQGELLASFRPHLAALALVCAVVCLLLWRPLPALGLVAVAALNVAPVVLAYRGAPAPAQAGAPTLRIAHQNAQGGFGGPVRILEHLQDDPTDVLVVLDPAPDWAVFLRDAAPVLGYELVLPTSGAADDRVLVLSRVPLLDVRAPQQAGLPPSAVEMTATLGQEPVRLLAVHTRNPLTPERWRLRNDQLHAIARWVEDQQDPTVVLGDLNDTKDTKSTRAVLGRGKHALVDTRPAERNGDNRPNPNPRYDPRNITWTHYYGKEDTYSRIDYLLISRGMAREWSRDETYVLALPNWSVASDHRPIVAGFIAEDK